MCRGERFPKEKVEATRAKSALKDTADPVDVAEQVRTLVMSKSITGQNIVIDCGIAI
jgi:enoyl-[acyl-carrier-protein] reductase (NADH)